MRSLFIFVFMFFVSLSAYASELKMYNFTSDFVRCVKAHGSETNEFVRYGLTDSSLMNGRVKLSGNKIDDNYWTYMNCLSKTNGGTRNGSVSAASTCKASSLVVNNRRIDIPPGVEGKRIGVAGAYFECSGTRWLSISGTVIDPTKQRAPPAAEGLSPCAATTKELSGCRFLLSATSHGQNAEDYFGAIYGDASSSYEGRMLAFCKNGNFEVSESECQKQTCASGEMVYWKGLTTDPSKIIQCEATVAFDGIAIPTPSPIRYFSSIEQAREYTEIRSGRGQFLCSQGRWTEQVGSSSCEQKTLQSLSCDFIVASNGQKKYYCH
jgi:hypothetical protein